MDASELAPDEGVRVLGDLQKVHITPNWTRYSLCITDTTGVRLRGIQTLLQGTAVEERPGGSEVPAAETLLWRRDGADVVIELTRKHLRPGQFVTVRWDFPRAAA